MSGYIIYERVPDRFVRRIHERMVHFYLKDTPKFFLNRKVNAKLAGNVADLQYFLEHQRVRLAKQYERNKEGFLTDPEIDTLYKAVADAEEEYKVSKKSLYAKALLEAPFDVRRWVFRSFRNRTLAVNILKFIHLYNEWTLKSAEYLIIEARKEHDALKFQQIIETVDDEKKKFELVEAKAQVDDEYSQKLSQTKSILSAQVADLYALVTKMNDEYDIIRYLEIRESGAATNAHKGNPLLQKVY